MSKSEKYDQLNQDMKRFKKVMSQASDTIRDKDVSDYPIFVVHQQEVSIGIPLVEKEKIGGLWNIQASSLEEFVSKNIIHEQKLNNFKSTYKSPEDFLCLFVLSELGAQFVFIPKV